LTHEFLIVTPMVCDLTQQLLQVVRSDILLIDFCTQPCSPVSVILGMLPPNSAVSSGSELAAPGVRRVTLYRTLYCSRDRDPPIGLNPLSRVPDDLKPIVADGVVSAFRHVWPDSWGPRLDYILTSAVRALLDVPGATLLMLPRLLTDDNFRTQLVDHHVS